jgi:hypothetical protein
MSIVAKKDYPDGYPSDALEVLRTMSFTNGKSVNIVGSMSLRSQIYAGDYDADEVVLTHGIRSLAVKDLVRKFKQIIRDLQRLPNTYIGDIKSGSVEEWVIVHEPYSYEKSLIQLEKLRKEKIIDEALYRDGLRRFRLKPSKLEILRLRRDFRPNVIRWTPREALLGFKKLQDGRKFTLEEAFQTPIITKLDVISWVQNNRFTDFSMIYQFKNNDTLLNPGMGDIDTSIRENIFMLYHEGNYFKMAKRMFALAKYNKYMNILEKLSPLFNGDVGRLYMVYGDIGTLINLFDDNHNIRHSILDIEIDNFKARLSNIRLDKYIHHEHEIFRMIDRITSMRGHSRENTKEILKKIQKILSELMSSYAHHYLTSMKLMPTY